MIKKYYFVEIFNNFETQKYDNKFRKQGMIFMKKKENVFIISKIIMNKIIFY